MSLRRMLELQEHAILHPAAAFSDQSEGRTRLEKTCSVRPAFQHDRDKILHCKSFRRLLHKTQVFLSPQGDHFRTRLTHTLEVSQIARTLARALRLNEQLTEAIALGHDLGHTPFGHAGEKVLHQLIPGGFQHVAQSVRVVRLLERSGRGLNLTREVVDGIGHHSKGRGGILRGAGSSLPRTLEGQLVRVADIVAYVNHDLDDAMRAGIMHRRQIPKKLLRVLGSTHSQRIDRMVKDILAHTVLDQEPRIHMSAEVEEALAQLRDFLWDNVYENPLVHAEFVKCHKLLSDLYHGYLSTPEIFGRFSDQPAPKSRTELGKAIGDFLAGMTDRFALRAYEVMFVPLPWPQSVG